MERSHPFTDEDHAFFAAGDALSAEPSAGPDSFDDLEAGPRPSLLRRVSHRLVALFGRRETSELPATSLPQPAACGQPLSVPQALHGLLDFLEERRASTHAAADLAAVSRELRDRLTALEAAVVQEELSRVATTPREQCGSCVENANTRASGETPVT